MMPDTVLSGLPGYYYIISSHHHRQAYRRLALRRNNVSDGITQVIQGKLHTAIVDRMA